MPSSGGKSEGIRTGRSSTSSLTSSSHENIALRILQHGSLNSNSYPNAIYDDEEYEETLYEKSIKPSKSSSNKTMNTNERPGPSSRRRIGGARLGARRQSHDDFSSDEEHVGLLAGNDEIGHGSARNSMSRRVSDTHVFRKSFEDAHNIKNKDKPITKRIAGWITRSRRGSEVGESRTVEFLEAERKKTKYPANVVRNQKYSAILFLPLVLYSQFKMFYNLYFLLVALSQFIPALKIGFIATYIAPLTFVLCITIGKEAVDDHARYKRDVESNSTPYETLVPIEIYNSQTGNRKQKYRDDVEGQTNSSQSRSILKPSSKLRVGDLVVLHKNQRVPADMVLLKTSSGDHSNEVKRHNPGTESAHFVLGDDDETVEADQISAAKADDAHEDLSASSVEEPRGDEAGTCFVRTDQLDGETDWKLRVAVSTTQRMSEDELAELQGRAGVFAGPPIKDIHTFVGNLTVHPPYSRNGSLASSTTTNQQTGLGDLIGTEADQTEDYQLRRQNQVSPLTSENVLWANTVLAAGSAIGLVIYTGKDTRAVMNTSHPSTKFGILDLELNKMSKILFAFSFTLSFGMVALNGFRGQWYIYVFRFLILFSSIIPISLRVNMDMGKTVYARQIMSDREIPGTIVRTSTLPEELGRIEYLLSDKTGTLTQNEMELKKLHMGTMSYSWDSMDEVLRQLTVAFDQQKEQNETQDALLSPTKNMAADAMFGGRIRRDMSSRVKDVVLALALCHNVTPVDNDDGTVTYQASSPDEVAIVRWTQSVGLVLVSRDRSSITLKSLYDHGIHQFDILDIFPFTSESKRMGIVVRDRRTNEVTFYQKGADVVMAKIVAQNDWLDEECGNMAREGLRTLVVGRKRLTTERWQSFESAYHAARIQVDGRNEAMAKVVDEFLERDLELLGLTGVEDKLQDDVKTTLELLRNAGVKVWMLTGDKIETATCIAISSKLVARNQYIHQVAKLQTRQQVRDMLDFLASRLDCCLVIDGESLQRCLDNYSAEFFELSTQLTSVVACRCSPTQKAEVAKLIQAYTKKRVCCIGDGGNDVSMIQAANVGLGIQGKEGMQASLAADFSLSQFSHLTKLVVWHGRNSYQRSAKLAQFVIHRGLIIAIIQAVFSSIFYFSPIALYQGWLMVGYATIYTAAPAFSLTLDRDVSEDVALLYPELFKGIGRALTAKTFTEWLIISIYQGGAIMIVSLYVFERELINILSISFTALILNELIMVALEITTWHVYMILAEILSLLLYCVSMAFLPEFFDLNFVLSSSFVWKTAIIVAVSSLPLYIIKFVRQRISPPAYSKLNTS